ncbi:MAG: M50 family metallopeptidase [Sedimentisphaerales bacterium]|nr:M50 family metallopeptidase [Sedimentisphaerales bacterium]
MARKIVLAVLVCVFVGGIVVFSFPQRYLPERLMSQAIIEGDFSGERVKIAIPGSKADSVRVSLRISGIAGTCIVSHENAQGDILWVYSMRAGTLTNSLPGGHTLVVESRGADGNYRVTVGSQWGLFGSSMRLVIVASCLGGLAGLGAMRSRKVANIARRIGVQRICFGGAVAVVSGLVLYPIVHEFGHYIVGIMLGGEASEVVWTVFSGGEPHVSFSSMPEWAGPWMSAAGPILPTLVAVVLIAIWLMFSKRIPWYLGVCLVVPAVVFLFSNVGCVFELFDSGAHMNRLSSHLGLRGVVRVLFELLPLFVSLVMFGLVGWRISGMTKSDACEGEQNPA